VFLVSARPGVAGGLSGRAEGLPRHRSRLHQSGGRLHDGGRPVESGRGPRSGAVARARAGRANAASCGVGTSVFLCSGWGQKWVRLVFEVWAPNGGRLAGGSACPTRLHLTPWWHGGEARIGRAGRKLLNGNGIKSWSLGTGSAER